MKRNCIDHPKTELLQMDLGVSLAQTIGHLELLFHFTAKYAPAGDIGRYPDAIIAKRCGWDGDPERFIAAMTSCRWIDESKEHRLIVHDWHEHADDAVHIDLARKAKRFANGTIPNTSRLSREEREKVLAAYSEAQNEEHAHTVRTKSAQEAHPVRTRSALPSPPLPCLKDIAINIPPTNELTGSLGSGGSAEPDRGESEIISILKKYGCKASDERLSKAIGGRSAKQIREAIAWVDMEAARSGTNINDKPGFLLHRLKSSTWEPPRIVKGHRGQIATAP